MTTPTIDASANSGTSFHNTNTGTVSLTTTNAGDLILMLYTADSFQGLNSITSPNTTGWTKYTQLNTARGFRSEVWYGFASAALSSETFTCDAAPGIDCAALTVIGITCADGPYTGESFDPDISLPANASYFDNSFVTSSPQIANLSTSGLTPLVFALYNAGQGATPFPQTPEAGWTSLYDFNSNAGVHNSRMAIEYKATSLSNDTVSYQGAAWDWGLTVFAVGPPSGARTGTWSSTERKDTLHGTLVVTDNGTWASTEAKDVFRMSGWQPDTGTWTSTEAVDKMAAAGNVGNGAEGSWFSTENADRFLAIGLGATVAKPRRVFMVN